MTAKREPSKPSMERLLRTIVSDRDPGPEPEPVDMNEMLRRAAGRKDDATDEEASRG